MSHGNTKLIVYILVYLGRSLVIFAQLFDSPIHQFTNCPFKCSIYTYKPNLSLWNLKFIYTVYECLNHTSQRTQSISITNTSYFDVHVTVHRVKFLIIKATRCTNFSNLFLAWNSTCFRQFLCPSSGDFHSTHGNGICYTGLLSAASRCQQTCITMRGVSSNNKFEKLVHIVGFIVRKYQLINAV